MLVFGHLLGKPERYINTCCEPNAYVKTIEGVRWVVAYREISVGDEVTYDYCIDSYGDTVWACGCQHRKCRRTISANFFDFPREKLIEYLPLLNPWFRGWRVPELKALRAELFA